MASGREKELEEMRKNVAAQEDRLGEALRIFNQISQAQPKSDEGPGNVVLWETMNTAITILGDLLTSYRKYTEVLEKAVEKSARKIELYKLKEFEETEKKTKKGKAKE